MAIDSMLYSVPVPTGSYTEGQVIPLSIIKGPAVVRDGYGSAILKRFFCSLDTGAGIPAHIEVKNQNWIDYIANGLTPISAVTLADTSSSIQRCGDVALEPNSSFSVNLVFDADATTTNANDVFVLLDIDYPSVNAVHNPKEETGTPCTILQKNTIKSTAVGSSNSPIWTSFNVDVFKAGFRYLLSEIGMRIFPAGTIGFFSISGASGQNGLERILPVNANSSGALRFNLDYSTPLVKGPMNLNYMIMASTSADVTAVVEMDYIRR